MALNDYSIKKASALRNLALGKELSVGDIELLSEDNKTLEEYFKIPAGDKREVKYKKLIIASLIEAKEKGALPFELNLEPETFASLVDQSLTKSKADYKVAKGEMTEEEATNFIIDDIAANVIALADNIIAKGIPLLAPIITSALISEFPQIAPVAPIIQKLIISAVPTIQKYINVGIKMLAGAAKAYFEEINKPIENPMELETQEDKETEMQS